MNNHNALRHWLLWLVLCALAVVACLLYADQLLAIFFDVHLRHTQLWESLNHTLSVLALVVVIALFFLLGCGIWAASGRRLAPWTQRPLLCSWSAMFAVAAEIIFKRIFGRIPPDPGYIQHHLYGFRFFHSDQLLGSFPSGTAAVSAAIVSVLWIVAPKSRVVGSLVVAVLSALVVVMNYHWLSDVIAGVFLGVSVGWSTVRLLQDGFPIARE